MNYSNDIRIMTNNVKRDVNIGARAGLMIKNYLRYMPDVLGLQECDPLAYKEVIDPILNQYNVVATVTSSNGDFSRTPILYKKDKYEKVDEWCDFLTARYTDSKTYSVVVLKDKESGKMFALINVHFAIIIGSYPKEIGTDSEVGNMWRVSNAKQVVEITEEIVDKYGKIPVFLTGDFNSTSKHDPYKILTEIFEDTLVTAKQHPEKMMATFHRVGESSDQNGLPYDTVFVTKNSAEVIFSEIIDDQDMINSTDHLAVIADVKI